MGNVRRRLEIAVAVVVALLVVLPRADCAAAADKDIQVLRAFSRAIAKVAGEVRPAVVSIYTTKTVRVPVMPGFPGMPFDWRFGEPFGRGDPREPQPREHKFRRRGLGSGFIVDAKQGYIVTNYHVVGGAEDIKVRLADGREFDGTLVGADKKTDLAVVRINAKRLKQIALGSSDRLKVGEFVIAVGSPFGLRETVTAGIVSAKGRSNLAIEDYEDFIQTDAAINMGNSGGPLVSIEGKVVGVNTAILSGTGGSVGVGFAIPIDMAKSIVRQLIDSGKVVRGWLGVAIQEVTPDMAERFGLTKAEGALVSQVLEGTPAAKADLRRGDVIVKYNEHDVASVPRFRARVAATAPGTAVAVVVVRDRKRRTLTAKIGRLTEDAIASASGATTTKSLGLSVQSLSPDLAKGLGLRPESGVVVSSVAEGSPAEEKGIRQGDVIIEVNRRPVKNAVEFQAALRGTDLRRGVLLLVKDRRSSRFVVLKARGRK